MRSEAQSERRAELEAQRRALAAACTRRGWQLVEALQEAGLSATDPKRPGIQEAVRVLEHADAQALVASKQERLAQALLELVALLASAHKQGWALVALDCTLETTTPAGEQVATLLATFAQFERRLISQRTRAALARTRAQGVRLGRPPTMSPMRSTGSGPSEQPATASRRSRTDSTRIASPPRRAAEERRVSNVNYLFWVAPSS